MASQQIIHERALVQERQIVAALGAYKQWRQISEGCTDNDTSDTPEILASRELHKTNLLGALGAVNCDVLRAAKTLNMNDRETRSYKELNLKIESEIEDTKTDIRALREQLRDENVVRRNKLEYDVLAGMTQEHPSRQESMKNIDDLQKEIDLLNAESNNLDMKLNMRKRQFHALLLAVKGIRTTLNDEAASTVDDPMLT